MDELGSAVWKMNDLKNKKNNLFKNVKVLTISF